MLGAGWLMVKTEHALHGDARRWGWITTLGVAVFLAAVSLATLFVHPEVARRWGVAAGGIDWGRLIKLSPIPLLGAVGLAAIAWGLKRGSHRLPFAGGLLVFVSGYLGLAVGFTPYVVPYAVTYEQAAAPSNALGLLLAGAAFALPLTLAYSAWVYWLFRGKVGEEGYHS